MSRVFVAIMLVAISTSTLAHPGHSTRNDSVQPTDRFRNWTIVPTNDQFRGIFVAKKDGQFQIRRADNSLVSVSITDLIESDRVWVEKQLERIRSTNLEFVQLAAESTASFGEDVQGLDNDDEWRNLKMARKLPQLLAQVNSKGPQTSKDESPEIAKAFIAFVKTKALQTRWDENYFYVESNGIPDHQMMVGITSWQQQVPLPQRYTGENAWRIPLTPRPAKEPLSTKNRFLRGAIALAVNGVPIFNPLNNRGEDAYLFGELDEFGGHCGRADDYHYHLAPVHLEKAIGKGLPIAYALDGYPIYGYEEPDGTKVKGLDAFNGHEDDQGRYHYHATQKYPYLNGGFHGEVIERGDQVDPQPRSEPIRPDLRPLRDAKITDFVETRPGSFRLTYELRGKQGSVSYTLGENNSTTFTFVAPTGETKTETYTPRRRRR